MRLAVEIVRRVREAVGPDFILIYRISLIDLIPDGSSWPEVVELARAVMRGRGDDPQYRHRLARSARSHHRHQRAARGLHLGHEEAARRLAR